MKMDNTENCPDPEKCMGIKEVEVSACTSREQKRDAQFGNVDYVDIRKRKIEDQRIKKREYQREYMRKMRQKEKKKEDNYDAVERSKCLSKEYAKRYRQKTNTEIKKKKREYMREYMKQYRERKMYSNNQCTAPDNPQLMVNNKKKQKTSCTSTLLKFFGEEKTELKSSCSRQCRIHHSPEYQYSKGIEHINLDKPEIDQIIVVKSEPIEDESEAAIIPNTRNLASHLQHSSNEDRLCDIELEPSEHVYSPPVQNERIGAKLQSLYDNSEVNHRPSDCDDLLSYIKIEPTAIENSWHDLSDSSTQ